MALSFKAEQRATEEAKYILRSQHTNLEQSIKNDCYTTLPELLKWQAHHRADATLFSFQESNFLTTLSYKEAYESSHRLAISLQRYCFSNPVSITQQPVVGIWFEKGIDIHLAILATTISGAAWLPFDPDAPTTRIAACLQDSDACILLCDEAHYTSAVDAVEQLGNGSERCCTVLTFEELSQTTRYAGQETGRAIDIRGPSPEDTAYLIYTSGSTGTPKGIEISHHAALTFCLSERSILESNTSDIVWQGFSPAFDMFIEEVWVSIAGGAHIAIGSRSECRDVPALGGPRGIWAQRGVTVVNAVPTLINMMTSLDDSCPVPPCLRVINLGGEACPASLIGRLSSPNLRIFVGVLLNSVTSFIQILVVSRRRRKSSAAISSLVEKFRYHEISNGC